MKKTFTAIKNWFKEMGLELKVQREVVREVQRKFRKERRLRDAAVALDFDYFLKPGISGHAVSEEDCDAAIAVGDSAKSAASGDRALAISAGNAGNAIAAGSFGTAVTLGQRAIAASIGINGTAGGQVGNWLVLAQWEYNGNDGWYPANVKAVLVDGETIKAKVLYTMRDGEIVEGESFHVESDGK